MFGWVRRMKSRLSMHRYGYAPKYGGGGGAAGYQQPKHSSYGSDYAAPYVTGSCYGQYPGMYGNADYDCKSYSVCQADGRLDVLHCPPYTRFNNYLGVCDWHFKVPTTYLFSPYNHNPDKIMFRFKSIFTLKDEGEVTE